MTHRWFPALIGGLVFVLAAIPAPGMTQTPAPTGHDTGIRLAEGEQVLCIDRTHAHTLIVVGKDSGTIAYDWQTGHRTLLAPLAATECAPDGRLYQVDTSRSDREPTIRRLDNSTPQVVQQVPDRVGPDGRLYAYPARANAEHSPTFVSFSSVDGGTTWEEHDLDLGGRLKNYAIAQADGRVVYVLAAKTDSSLGGLTYETLGYLLYATADGGDTWELRNQGVLPYITADVQTGDGPTSPVTWVQLHTYQTMGPDAGLKTLQLSQDGGRTFKRLDDNPNLPSGISRNAQLIHPQNSVLLFNMQYSGSGHDIRFSSWSLDRSPDEGATWEQLTGFPIAHPGEAGARLWVAEAAPTNVFVSSPERLLYSPDEGSTWQTIPPGYGPALTPYLPLTLIGLQDNRLITLNLPEAGRHQTAPMPPSGSGDGTYFPPTGHNLSGLFRAYWETYGGLAQFGYPRTEAFAEVNPTDGRVYRTQYFERNRFEYHPESAGTPAAIQLGLLGSEQTAARRAAGEAPFRPVADPAQPAVLYFAATGHTLRGPFRAYWEAHGGLALYGYPISEPFGETNPSGNQAYLVQYFQRNRFEYHPENQAPYDVLLGLLGNTLLAQKGWQ